MLVNRNTNRLRNRLKTTLVRNIGGVAFPITIDFDGDESSFFDGGWAEAGGNVTNDQIVLGSELVTNGDFASDLTGWNNLGGSEYNTFEFDAGTMHLVDTDGASKIAGTDDNVAVVTGNWCTASYTRVVNSGANPKLIVAVSLGGGGRLVLKDTSLIGSFRSIDTTNYVVEFQTTAVSDFNVDNVTMKQLTFTSLLNVLKSQFGLSDGFFIDIKVNAVTPDTQIGGIWNYDGANNFGGFTLDATNLKVFKSVAGTYTDLASVAQAVTQDQILRIENPTGTNALDILYNGVSKATPTISDAGIISNTGIALFSTEANNAISQVTIGLL